MPFTGATFNLLTNTWYPSVPDTVLESADSNAVLEDIQNALTAVVTRDGAGSMSGSLNMGNNKVVSLAAATNPSDAARYDQVQPVDATLTAIAALSFDAINNLMYSTGADTFALLASTAAGRAFLTYVDPGADKIPYWKDADGTIASVSLGTGFSFSGGTLSLNSALTDLIAVPLSQTVLGRLSGISAFGATLIDDSDAATARSTLGLGTAAVKNTGTSGNTVPLLDGVNTWSAAQTLSASAVVGDGTSSKSLTLKGANSGSAGGTLLVGNNGGAAAWAIGNYSAIFGGSYDPDIILYNAINDGKYYVALSGLKKEIVNTDNVVTMTNKTLSSPTLSGTVAGSATLSGVITHSNTVAMQSSNEVQFFSSGYSIRASTGLEIKTADSIRFLVGSTEYGRVDNTGLKARIAVSSETSGSLTSTSANKQIDAAGGITIPASVFSAGDRIAIYAGASSRTLTQGSGGTQRLHGTSTTGNLTLAARGEALIRFISATEWVVMGDVS